MQRLEGDGAIRLETSGASPTTSSFHVLNPAGERLACVMHEAPSHRVCILCHGYAETKNWPILVEMAEELARRGWNAVRFDFRGNGDSEGHFSFANYMKEVEDVRAVAEHLRGRGMEVTGLLGHSKGGDVVLLYASKHDDIPRVVNVAGRFHMKEGVVQRFGQGIIDQVLQEGSATVRGKKGSWVLTRESYEERMSTDMASAACAIRTSRVMTVHETGDRVIPVQDAHEFDSRIPNHRLVLIDGASHLFHEPDHRQQLCDAAIDFLTAP